MEIPKSIRIYSAGVVALGVYNLLGAGSYDGFAPMFRGFPAAVAPLVYVFTVFYGISGVYCGSRMMRLEDWARKMMVALTSMSVITGFMLNRRVFENLKEFVSSELAGVSGVDALSVYKYAVIFAGLITFFEISVVWFFTRAGVRESFRRREV